MNDYLKLLRVKHYIKNVLVFMPLFFAGNIFNFKLLVINFGGFINFCFAASIIYIINDMQDVEKDRKHPTKCTRPLASGAISFRQAYVIIGLLVLITISINLIVNRNNVIAWLCIILYIISNLMYSLGLKNVVLVDVFILALGYILRLYYGAFIVNIEVSSWLYLTVMTFAFYLGLGKRRNEFDRNSCGETRKVLQKYNREFLDKNMHMCLAIAIVFYSLWTENVARNGNDNFLLFSVPIIIVICMRYSFLVEGESDGDPIEVIYKDRVMVYLILCFVIFMFFSVYFMRIINI